MCRKSESETSSVHELNLVNYPTDSLYQEQLQDLSIGPIIEAKQRDAQPTSLHQKRDSTEFQCWMQIWNQLFLKNGLLYTVDSK